MAKWTPLSVSDPTMTTEAFDGVIASINQDFADAISKKTTDTYVWCSVNYGVDLHPAMLGSMLYAHGRSMLVWMVVNGWVTITDKGLAMMGEEMDQDEMDEADRPPIGGFESYYDPEGN